MKKGKVTVCRICCAATPARAGYWKNTVVFISLKKAKQQQKTSGKNPLLAVILFCSLIWQNRSYYLVYPHGNLTVYHVVYIFSANAGLRQPVRSAAGDFRGSLKFARYDQNTSLMPCSPCMRGNIFTGMTEEAWGGKATFVPLSQGSTSTLTCSPRSSLKKSFAGIIGFLIRYEVSSPFTRCARMLW